MTQIMNQNLADLRRQLAEAEAAERDAQREAEKELLNSITYSYHVNWHSDYCVRVTRDFTPDAAKRLLAFYNKEDLKDLPSNITWCQGGMTYIAVETADGNYILAGTGGGTMLLRYDRKNWNGREVTITREEFTALKQGRVLHSLLACNN